GQDHAVTAAASGQAPLVTQRLVVRRRAGRGRERCPSGEGKECKGPCRRRFHVAPAGLRTEHLPRLFLPASTWIIGKWPGKQPIDHTRMETAETFDEARPRARRRRRPRHGSPSEAHTSSSRFGSKFPRKKNAFQGVETASHRRRKSCESMRLRASV